jgi:alanyl-tRNA synthetase
MTERIYYRDPYCREFEARVEAVDRHEGRAMLVLDRTAFYPTSGGQPCDAGQLGGARVDDVLEREDGTIVHQLEAGQDPTIASGDTIRGVVDWTRRFDHMQQHTGQHILSAAFDRLSKARTVGFHLGAEVSSVDLAIDLPARAVLAAETEANRVVWEDRPVAIRFVSSAEAASLPLRKEPERAGLLRVIDVEGYDLSACGGTHVNRSGEVGLIAIRSWERFRGGLRLEFGCGGRALASYRTLRDAIAGSIRHLSVLPNELPGAIERAQADNKAVRKSLKQLQDRLAGFEAEALAARAPVLAGRRQVVDALEGWDATGLKTIALAIASRPGCDAALFSRDAPVLAVVACAPQGRADAGQVLRALLSRFGGKGGGRADFAQGGGLIGPVEEMLDVARAALGGG